MKILKTGKWLILFKMVRKHCPRSHPKKCGTEGVNGSTDAREYSYSSVHSFRWAATTLSLCGCPTPSCSDWPRPARRHFTSV